MDTHDDDFGDIYEDVEAGASLAINDVSCFASLSVDTKKEDDVNTGELKLEYTSDDEVHTENLEAQDSDSEDDLNIVLNDEYCEPFLDGRNDVIGSGEDDNVLATKANGNGGETENMAKVGYNSQYPTYKYTRLHGPAFPGNTKPNQLGGLASFSTLSRSDSETSGGFSQQDSLPAQTTGIVTNSVLLQRKYRYYLPYYRNILEVDINTFEQKPWRHQGVDMTHYFNYGFDETSWKEYCDSLGQFQQQMVTKTRVQETADQAEAGLSSSYADIRERLVELPKGQAISVGGSLGERQSSIDIRRPRVTDSDVVIQIPLQASSDEYSPGLRKKERHTNQSEQEASENDDPDLDDNKCIHSSNCNEQLSESLEENSLSWSPKPVVGSDQASMRPKHFINEQDGNVDDCCHENENSRASKGINADAEGAENTKREIDSSSHRPEPCITETVISSCTRSHFGPTLSCFDSDSESSNDSVQGDHEEYRSTLRRHSLSPDPELLDSVVSTSFGRKSMLDSKTYSKNRNRFHDMREHNTKRIPAERKIYLDTDKDASTMRDSKNLHRKEHSTNCRGRKRESSYDYHIREPSMRYKDAESYRGCGGEKLAQDHSRTFHVKYPQKKVRCNVREWTDPLVRRYWNEREAFHVNPTVDDEDRLYQNWHHGGRELSAEKRTSPMYSRSREFVARYASTCKERDIQGRSDGHQETKRTNHGYLQEYKRKDDVFPERYGRDIAYANDRRDSLDRRYETFPASVDRGITFLGKRGRYDVDPLVDFDRSCRKMENEHCRHHRDHQLSWKSCTSYADDRRDCLDRRYETFPASVERGVDLLGKCERYDVDPLSDFEGSGTRIENEHWGRRGYQSSLKSCIPYAHNRRDSFDSRYDTLASSVESGVDFSGKRRRYDADPLSDLDGSCSKVENEYWRRRDYQSSWEPYTNARERWHHALPSRNQLNDHSKSPTMYKQDRRDILIEEDRGTDLLASSYDAIPSRNQINEYSKSPITYRQDRRDILVEEDRCTDLLVSSYSAKKAEIRTVYNPDLLSRLERNYSCSSKALHWVDDKSIKQNYSWRSKALHLADDESIKCVDGKTYAKTARERFSGRFEEAKGNVPKADRPLRKMIKGSSANSVNYHCSVNHRSKQDQTILKRKESVGLIVGEEKSEQYPRGRSLTRSAKEFATSKEKADKTTTVKSYANQVKQKLHCEADIEEGQIITEDPNNFKTRMLQNDVDAANQRILESLAKMEKRRERFKDPVPVNKETENTLLSQLKVVVDAVDDIKAQRPARKRRWIAS